MGLHGHSSTGQRKLRKTHGNPVRSSRWFSRFVAIHTGIISMGFHGHCPSPNGWRKPRKTHANLARRGLLESMSIVFVGVVKIRGNPWDFMGHFCEGRTENVRGNMTKKKKMKNDVYDFLSVGLSNNNFDYISHAF